MAIPLFYSKLELAREGSIELSDELKKTVYIWKQRIDSGQYEYQLRTAEQLMSVESEYVIHKEVYEKNRQQSVQINLPDSGIFRTLNTSDEPQLTFINTGPIEGKENYYGNIHFEGVEVGYWKCSQEVEELIYHLYMNKSQAFRLYSMQQLKSRATEIWENKMK